MSPSTLLTLFLAGLAAGFVDAIAGGGGLITVPALLYAGLPPQIALGTNKLQSSCGTALAVARYSHSKLIHWKSVRVAMAAAFLSAIAGALLVGRLPDTVLRKSIPALLLGVAGYMAFARAPKRLRSQTGPAPRGGGESMPPAGDSLRTHTLFGLSAGALLGFYDGFFGPGVGAFWTVACIGLLGLATVHATAYTKAANLASNLGALTVFLCSGKVRWLCAVFMIFGQLLGARAGSGLVVRKGASVIRPVVIVMAVALAVRLLV